MIKKILKWFFIFCVLLAILYLLGPKVKFDSIENSPITLSIPLTELDNYLTSSEERVSDIKLNNEAKIIWARGTKSKTEYAVVYLHGFSASREEGAPLHTDFAKRYGANLYLPRLRDHGRKTKDTFKNMTPQELLDSAREAVAIGKLLGEKVILMSCSTGGTYSIILSINDPAIHSMLMYSPNIDLYDPTSNLITMPWGKQLLNVVMDGAYNSIKYDSLPKQYWNDTYHTDGIIAMKYLIEETMTTENFEQIDIPFYMGYYYEDEEHQDHVVSVKRMLDFYDASSTPDHLKRKETLNEAKRHVMTSHVMSDHVDSVAKKLYDYSENILGLIPIEN